MSYCLKRCIDNQYLKQYQCLPNPFIYENFILINSSQTEHRICDQNKTDTKINEEICQKNCIKDCNELYFEIRFDNSLVLMTNNSKISIKFRNSLQYEYSSEKKYSFTDFMSNIGGLFGLWFGISFVDMSQLLINLKNYLLAHIDFNRIQANLLKFKRFKFIILIIYLLRKFKSIISYIDKINWKNVIHVLTLPFMLYQIWDLTDDYLKYPMDVSVEWFPYKDSNYRLSDESIPAITVCYEHIFERILFDENVQASFRYNFNMTDRRFYPVKEIRVTKDPFIKNLISFYDSLILGFEFIYHYEKPQAFLDLLLYYLDVNNKTEFIERQFRLNDKTSNDFNRIQQQFYFFSFIVICNLGIDAEAYDEYFCNHFRENIRIISPFGQCFTFLSEIQQAQTKNDRSFKTEFVFSIRESRIYEGMFQNIRYFKKKFFIHTSKELPDFTINEFELTDNSVIQLNSYRIVYNRIDFKKLPKPYETNCRNYGRSNRFQCLNECYLNGYQQKWNCTPNDNHLLTVVLKNNSIEPKVKFCHKTDTETQIFNIYLRNLCIENCLESCEHVYFSTSIEVDVKNFDNMFTMTTYSPNFKFLIKENFYSQIIFNPRITFISLIISITNILSLWHGMSILSIFGYILAVVVVIMSKMKTHFRRTALFQISIWSSWLKVLTFLII